MDIECPHCKRVDLNKHHDIAQRDVKSYGSSIFTFKCTLCGKMYAASFVMEVLVDHIIKREKEAIESF